ncbi:hypothetical protein GCM10010470_29300 [Saccharopolyspora taberi]|uniref:FAD-binding domain-containing protein n=2 Tax=Saccharopolyspora taberi TaxID=60895 RepID=A0ABN3VDJ7_9PSEU
MLHRADLLDVLRSAVPEDALHAGIEVREVHTDGTVVHAGGVSSADLVVGADGIRSITRRTVFPHAPAPRYAGYRTWRMIAPPRQVRSVETWGKGDRFGYAPLPDGRVYCYAVVRGPEGASGDIHALRRRFADWHDPIPALLDSVADDVLLGHDSYELPDLPSFVSGRVALLGDAAHAMTPNLGQGGCQALEDAVVLGAAGDLGAYDRARRPRAQMIVRRSRRVGVVAHWTSPVAVAARNTAMRLAPGSALIRSMEPVLNWTP